MINLENLIYGNKLTHAKVTGNTDGMLIFNTVKQTIVNMTQQESDKVVPNVALEVEEPINNIKEETRMVETTAKVENKPVKNNNKEDKKIAKKVKNIDLFKTTADKVQTLAKNGKLTAEQVAEYCAMYPKCNANLEDVLEWWGPTATPNKAATGKGISRKRLDAIAALDDAAKKMEEIVDKEEIPVANTDTQVKTPEELFKERVLNMFTEFFVKNVHLANVRYNATIANLIANAAISKNHMVAGDFDFVTVYMAEDAVCKAIWNQWRNRTADKVRLGFVHMTLNKLVENGVLVTVRNNKGAVIGFKVSALEMGKKYGTQLVYKAKDGTLFETTKEVVKCIANNAEKPVSKEVLNWISRNASLVAVGTADAYVKAQETKQAEKPAGAAKQAKVAKKTKVDNRPYIGDMSIKDIFELYGAGKITIDTARQYCNMFPEIPVADGEVVTINNYIKAYGYDATPNSVKLAAQNKAETLVDEKPVNKVADDEEPFKPAPTAPVKKLTADEQKLVDKIDNAFFGDEKAETPVETPKAEKVAEKKDNNKKAIADVTIGEMIGFLALGKVNNDVLTYYLSLFNVADIDTVEKLFKKYGINATPNSVNTAA